MLARNNIIFFIIFSLFALRFNIFLCKSKIAIIGVHDEKYEEIGKWAHINKKAYAKKHGYDCFLYNTNLDIKRPPYWSKIIAILNHLDDYEWLLFLDSDALIMNFEIKLEFLIDNDYDLVLAKDMMDHFQSGDFLIRNSPFSKVFLKEWYSEKYRNTITPPGFDNGALIEMLEDNLSFLKKIKIIPQRMISSYPVGISNFMLKNDGEYRSGDFIIHFAGIPHSEKEKLMEEFSL